LIAGGALIDQKNNVGCAPLTMAVINNNASIVQALLEKNADMDTTNQFGINPLGLSRAMKLDRIITVFEEWLSKRQK
jgi:ankyrin repeat protein